MAIPYCYEACTACRMCTQLSSFAESEINGLVPQALSSFPSFAVRTVSDLSWVGTWEQDCSFSTQCHVNEKPACLWAAVSEQFFSSRGTFHAYVTAMCSKLRNLWTLPHRDLEYMYRNYWKFCLLRIAEQVLRPQHLEIACYGPAPFPF